MKRRLFFLLIILNISFANAANTSSGLVINELMASNAGTVMSPAYNFDSWIEIFNPTEQPVNLAGMYLSNNAENLTLWQMPSGIGTVPAKGFLVVWLGSDDIRSDQAPFKLDCDGGTIYLSDRSRQLVASMDYPVALSRTAYARTTDGGDEWGWTANPTPGATNATSVFANKRLNAPTVNLGSQLFNGSLTVKVNIPGGTTLMYTIDGSLPKAPKETGDDSSVPTSGWTQMVVNGDCEGEDATCFVCRDGDGDGDIPRITDGVGVNGSRGVKVHAIANPSYDWTSQFFIYVPDYTLKEGDKYRFSMKVRADKPSPVSSESHANPGNYIYWSILDGNYNITTEWQTITYEGIITADQAGESGMCCIAFKLNKNSEDNNFYFDDFSWELYVENFVSPWINWVTNGDCEGDDLSCLVSKNGDEKGDLITHVLDGVGYNGSRGIRVHSIDNPQEVWDSQFFVYTPDHYWNSGDRYRFSMKVRADNPARITPQSQRTPGNYIHWQMLDGGYDITTDWQEISYEGIITDEQSGNSTMQTIAFHLNESPEANNYYFDDIVWESYQDSDVADNGTSRQSLDGVFNVTQTTNYVFRLFKNGFLPSVPVTRSFIQTGNNYTIPIVSIVGDERYFTDPMWGIDVKGKNGITGNGSDDPVNWNQPWDRPVNFSYISPTDGMLFNQDVNISVSGGWTRKASPRSMKLKSNKVFDGLNRFDYSFFPQKPYIRNKTLLIRNGGNDVWENNSRFTDPALTTVIQRSGIDLDVQSCVQVAEYINGRFKGILNLREPSNDKFVYANYGYDDEEIDMFENGTFNNGTKDAYERLCELGEHINDAGVYEEVKQLLDIDEFTNYMATELFLGNDDWPENNVKAYRSQHDGRFRFICFDLDYSFNAWDRNSFNSVLDEHKDVKMVSLFLNLLKHQEYRRKFIDTYCIVAGSVFEKERAIKIVDELADAMRPMSQYDGYLPDKAANKIKDNLKTRLEDMMTRLQQYKPMNLTGITRKNVKLTADANGASIYINGIEVPYASFNGQLFPPITLEAKAPAGYTFTGWRQSTGSTISLFSNNDTWKYYDKGEQPDANWNSDTFNDASWKYGMAPFGYMMDGIKTTVSYGSDAQMKNPTTYFRKTFTLNASPTSNDIFLLNYQVDDGFVIWVNGQEAGRFNMPEGTVSYDTFSSVYAADVPFVGTIELSPLLFTKGNNVIAVEVHNTSYTSSDLYWTCELLTSVGTETDENVLTEPIISLPEGNSLSLTACFTPLTDDERKASGIKPVCINEVSAANDIYVNEYFKRNDWIELYNTTDNDIDVQGMYLSDNVEKPKKYQIAKLQTSTVIPAHGYLIVWCDKLEPQSQLHASFKLDADGGDVLLTAADESWSDILSYTAMTSDETVGRYPDGYRNVITMNVPTIAKSNITASYAIVIEQPDPINGGEGGDITTGLSLSYVADHFVMRSTTPITSAKMDIFNLAGLSFSSQTISLNSGYAELSLNELPSGCYIARLTDGKGHTTTCKFIKK